MSASTTKPAARFRTAAAAASPDERCCANCTAFQDRDSTCHRGPPDSPQVKLAEWPWIRFPLTEWCRDGFEARRNGK